MYCGFFLKNSGVHWYVELCLGPGIYNYCYSERRFDEHIMPIYQCNSSRVMTRVCDVPAMNFWLGLFQM